MTKTFQFELVSPEEKLISEPASFASIPGSEGVLGVLPGHSSVIAYLKPGVLEFTPANDGEKQKIFIAGGFADVSGENVTVLAEEAIPVKDLDRTALEQQLKNLNEDLGMAAGAADKARVQKQISLVNVKLSASAS